MNALRERERERESAKNVWKRNKLLSRESKKSNTTKKIYTTFITTIYMIDGK